MEPMENSTQRGIHLRRSDLLACLIVASTRWNEKVRAALDAGQEMPEGWLEFYVDEIFKEAGCVSND